MVLAIWILSIAVVILGYTVIHLYSVVMVQRVMFEKPQMMKLKGQDLFDALEKELLKRKNG